VKILTDHQATRHPDAMTLAGKQAPEVKTILDFNDARDDGVAVASARSYANHLRLALDR